MNEKKKSNLGRDSVLPQAGLRYSTERPKVPSASVMPPNVVCPKRRDVTVPERRQRDLTLLCQDGLERGERLLPSADEDLLRAADRL